MLYIIIAVTQVNIGIIDANPSTIAGTITIMEKLQQYVPQKRDGTFREVPTHGDQLSVERMIDATRARSADLNAEDNISSLIPIPQEFHHRGLMLQVKLCCVLCLLHVFFVCGLHNRCYA